MHSLWADPFVFVPVRLSSFLPHGKPSDLQAV